MENEILKANKAKYRIELTFDELKFITNTLDGITALLQWLHGDQHSNFDLCQLHGPGMQPKEVSDKIYKQYHDTGNKTQTKEAEILTLVKGGE